MFPAFFGRTRAIPQAGCRLTPRPSPASATASASRSEKVLCRGSQTPLCDSRRRPAAEECVPKHAQVPDKDPPPKGPQWKHVPDKSPPHGATAAKVRAGPKRPAGAFRRGLRPMRITCGPLWPRCIRWRAAPSSDAPWGSVCPWSCRCRRSCSRCARAPFRGCG